MRPLLSALLMAFLCSCATTGSGPEPKEDERPAALDLRLEEMSALLESIERAVLAGSLEEKRAELEAAAETGEPWAVVKAAFAEMPEDPDAAWARFREVTVTPRGATHAAYWAWLGMADISLRWGIHDQAERHIELALELSPGSLPARERQGLLALSSGEKEEGVSILEAVLAEEEGHRFCPACALELGKIALEAERWEEARGHLEALVSHHPRSVEARKLLATVAEHEGDLEEAARHLEVAAEEAPKMARISIRVARLREAAGDEEGALEAWKGVAEMRPDDTEPWRRQAALARELGDDRTEEAALDRLVRLDHEDEESLRRLARLRGLAGRAEAAAEAWDEILLRDSADGEALLARAELHIGADRFREAIADLRALLSAAEEGEHADGDDEEREWRLSEAERLLAEVSAKVGLQARPISGRTPDAVYAAVARVVNRAYRSRLEQLPALGGTFSVRVVVSGGRVVEAEIVENSLHDPVLEALVYWTIRDAGFPGGDRPGEFTLPFTLTPGSR